MIMDMETTSNQLHTIDFQQNLVGAIGGYTPFFARWKIHLVVFNNLYILDCDPTSWVVGLCIIGSGLGRSHHHGWIRWADWGTVTPPPRPTRPPNLVTKGFWGKWAAAAGFWGRWGGGRGIWGFRWKFWREEHSTSISFGGKSFRGWVPHVGDTCDYVFIIWRRKLLLFSNEKWNALFISLCFRKIHGGLKKYGLNLSIINSICMWV